jgi:hypothetical protein
MVNDNMQKIAPNTRAATLNLNKVKFNVLVWE